MPKEESLTSDRNGLGHSRGCPQDTVPMSLFCDLGKHGLASDLLA
jgi:hypothetical protein